MWTLDSVYLVSVYLVSVNRRADVCGVSAYIKMIKKTIYI